MTPARIAVRRLLDDRPTAAAVVDMVLPSSMGGADDARDRFRRWTPGNWIHATGQKQLPRHRSEEAGSGYRQLSGML